jgi:hypothetical protein
MEQGEAQRMLSDDDHSGQYSPRPAPRFYPSRIVLAKGSHGTTARRELAERICAAYPEAKVIESFGVPHNRVDLGESDPLWLHHGGKATLVLGEHQALRGLHPLESQEARSCHQRP